MKKKHFLALVEKTVKTSIILALVSEIFTSLLMIIAVESEMIISRGLNLRREQRGWRELMTRIIIAVSISCDRQTTKKLVSSHYPQTLNEVHNSSDS